MSRRKVELVPVVCDLNTKHWMNEKEAITYLGFGNTDHFARWRKDGSLPFFKVSSVRVYKRQDLDKLVEKHRIKKLLD